jgi:hypothetical protein
MQQQMEVSTGGDGGEASCSRTPKVSEYFSGDDQVHSIGKQARYSAVRADKLIFRYVTLHLRLDECSDCFKYRQFVYYVLVCFLIWADDLVCIHPSRFVLAAKCSSVFLVWSAKEPPELM